MRLSENQLRGPTKRTKRIWTLPSCSFGAIKVQKAPKRKPLRLGQIQWRTVSASCVRRWVVLGVPRRCSFRLGCVISESGPCLDDGWIMFWCFDQGWTMWELSIWQRNPEHSEICCVQIHPTLSVVRWTSYESMNGKFWRFLKRKVPTYPVQDTHGHRPSEQNEQFVY